MAAAGQSGPGAAQAPQTFDDYLSRIRPLTVRLLGECQTSAWDGHTAQGVEFLRAAQTARDPRLTAPWVSVITGDRALPCSWWRYCHAPDLRERQEQRRAEKRAAGSAAMPTQ